MSAPETYREREARESAEREAERLDMARRADEQRRAIRLARLDERIGRIKPWHSALVDMRGELAAQLEALDVDAGDRNTRRAARRRAEELADAIECIDRGPRSFGGLLDVPAEVEDGLRQRGLDLLPGKVSRSRFGGRRGLSASARLLEKLREERAQLAT